MTTKVLIFVETENGFIQHFEKVINSGKKHSEYELIGVTPQFTNGYAHMESRCLEDINTAAEGKQIDGIFVDLSIGDITIDSDGIQLGMGIRKHYPTVSIFCMTNKNKYDYNFDNFCYASLEDFDAVFVKDFMIGKTSSPERIEEIINKGKTKRDILKGAKKRKPLTSKTEDIKCDVVIVTALFEKEFEQVKHIINIDEKTSKRVGTTSTKYGKLKNSNLSVIVDYQQKMGVVDASILAASLTAKYNPKLLVMTGVCGSRTTKNVNIGDIIIPNEVYDYQTGKYEDGVYKPYSYRAPIEPALISYAREWKDEIMRSIEDSSETQRQKIKTTEVHFDIMACGSLVIKTDGVLENIAESLDEKTVAVEMESYGIARICNLDPYKNTTKSIIIKGSMDGTGISKSDDPKEWAAQISAKFAHHYLIKLEKEGYFK